MSRSTCPKCGAPVLPVRTPLDEHLLLDPQPLDDIYTIHRDVVGVAMVMPHDVTRRRHVCAEQSRSKK